MVAPLSYGAGLKGKVTQALAAGLPVVTTPIGAEGLDAVDGEQLLIGDDDRELADRVVAAPGRRRAVVRRSRATARRWPPNAGRLRWPRTSWQSYSRTAAGSEPTSVPWRAGARLANARRCCAGA